MASNSEIFAKVSKNLLKITSELAQRQPMKLIVKEAEIIIRRRTLLGFGVSSPGGPRSKLDKLSETYKEQRRGKVIFFRDKDGRVRRVPTSSKFKSRIKLSEKTTPGKSNLTLTGQMLASLRGKVTGLGKGIIEPTGSRTEGMTNKQIATFVQENGRVFMNFSNNEIRQLQIFVEDLSLKLAKKNLTKIN